MKYANIERSERLKRVAQVLAQSEELSTLDIIKKANVCAVNSIVSELRQNGYDISCERRGEKWFYRMEQS